MFCQGFIHALKGGKGLTVQSPTYALLNSYDTIPTVHHADLYRIGNKEHLGSLDLEEYFFDNNSFSLIEWPYDFITKHSEKTIEVHMTAINENIRELTILVPETMVNGKGLTISSLLL